MSPDLPGGDIVGAYRLLGTAVALGGLVAASMTTSAPPAGPGAPTSYLGTAPVAAGQPARPGPAGGRLATTDATAARSTAGAATAPGATTGTPQATRPLKPLPKPPGAQHFRPVTGLNEVRSDFNGDGRPDLAVSELRKVVNGGQSGAVHVLFGDVRGGFTNAGSQSFDHTTPGMPNDDGSPDPHSEINDFGRALASGDFDHDGYADLAIGSVHDRFRILYGGRSGLTTAEARMIRLADVAPAADIPGEGVSGENQFGSAFTVGDFDGDGTDDLVTGAPRAGRPWVGGVALFRGTPGGISPAAARYLPGNAPGMPVTPETDGFGSVLASADFDNDGRDDLAVGFHRDHFSNASFAGSVVVLPGAADGLSVAGARLFYQDTPGVPDVAEYGDSFGAALAAGDITGDGYADLVVATDSEGFSSNTPNRGSSITVLRGSSGGLTVDGAQYWTQRSRGIPGSDDPSAYFGTELAFADFDNDGRGDIAVASPQEDVANVDGAGAITILRGSAQGLTTTGLRRLEWTTPGMPANTGTPFHYFGDVLRAVRQPDGAASLVVGCGNATISDLQRAGRVIVLRSTPATPEAPGGVTTNGHSTWSASDLPVGPQAFAAFGGTLG
ncbi:MULTISPECIES: VCBS repeat-containing protein [unclassified Micromonospora]|uniref:VCBS repeat-containing protein n=1 Tax=unclassified Micromonospora TaxID=2617518 RepID=UPI002FF02166